MALSKMYFALTAGAAALALAGCNKAGTTTATESNAAGNTETAAANSAAPADPVASAESAAPAAIAQKASIVTLDANGAMSTVRQGSNGWTCMPDSPTTPGPDPMCFDANAGKWVDAWVHH